MNMLDRSYLAICLAITSLFGYGAHRGWSAPPPFSLQHGKRL